MATTTDKQPAKLEMHRVICTRHGEVFRHRWPRGYVRFCTIGFKLVVDGERFAAATEGKVEEIGPQLDITPICCRLSDEQLLSVYEQTRVGRRRRCGLCKRKRDGTSYRIEQSAGSSKFFVIPHVCFRCVVMRPGVQN